MKLVELEVYVTTEDGEVTKDSHTVDVNPLLVQSLENHETGGTVIQFGPEDFYVAKLGRSAIKSLFQDV